MRLTTSCASLASALMLSLFLTADARATTLAAQVNVTGTTNATTAATVLHQTAGAALFVATNPTLNLGDLSLLVGASTVVGGGSPLTQAASVIIACPNQFQYAAVGNRNIIETPGEVTGAIPGGFPTGMWLSTTNVAGAGAEANFRLSMTQFQFSDGWISGHVSTVGTVLGGNTSAVTVTPLPMLPTAAFGNGHYQLSIAGVNSRFDGMLFGMSEQNDTSGNAWEAGVLPDGSGWDIRITDQGGNFPAGEAQPWSFVYVPYATTNLVAAGNLGLSPRTNSSAPPTSVDVLSGVGTFTASLVDIGNSTANASIIPPTGVPAFPTGGPDGLLDAGRILIQIPGKDDTTGVLLVGVSKLASSGGVDGADDNMLAYEYNAALGGFLVESYDLNGANLQNSDIYFAYFDYSNPIVPEPASVCLAVVGLLALGFHRAVRGSRADR